MVSETRQIGVGRAPCGQAGSALVVVLLVLVLLTVAGLTLGVLTQTEVRIAANERLATTTLYAAESGVAMSVARAIVANDHAPRTYVLEDRASGALRRGERIEVAALQPLASSPCNLCEINQGSVFARITHGVTATAWRAAAVDVDPGSEGVRVAEKSLTVMIDIQPRQPSVDAVRAASESSESLRF